MISSPPLEAGFPLATSTAKLYGSVVKEDDI